MTWIRWVGSIVLALIVAVDPWWQGKRLPISWAIAIFCGLFTVNYFGIREFDQKFARMSTGAAFIAVTLTQHLINNLGSKGKIGLPLWHWLGLMR